MSNDPKTPAARDAYDLWRRFKEVSRARINLGRSGDALPTRHALQFDHAHALARDAVFATVDFDALATALDATSSVRVRSLAGDRSTYLRRPDLGRALDPATRARLQGGPFDVVVVIADGLSASAVQMHAVPMFEAMRSRLPQWRVGPVVFAEQARVALGDAIGAALGATMVVVLIGERPGLSVPNSLGIYLTYAPQPGCRDSQRNCISNVHAHGLSYERAALKLVWLMQQARTLRTTGVLLKEDAPEHEALDAAQKALDSGVR